MPTHEICTYFICVKSNVLYGLYVHSIAFYFKTIPVLEPFILSSFAVQWYFSFYFVLIQIIILTCQVFCCHCINTSHFETYFQCLTKYFLMKFLKQYVAIIITYLNIFVFSMLKLSESTFNLSTLVKNKNLIGLSIIKEYQIIIILNFIIKTFQIIYCARRVSVSSAQ